MSDKDLIYFVDDEKEILLSFAEILNHTYRVRIFDTPKEVLAAIDMGEVPTVIVSDLNMPDMTGLELSQRLMELGYELPVILMSGYMDKDHSIKAVNNGVFGILEKPFELNAFRDMIHKAVEAQNWNLKNKKFRDSAADFVKASIEVMTMYKKRYTDAERLLKDLGLIPVSVEEQLTRVMETSQLEEKVNDLVTQLDDLNREGEDSIRKAA
jgi:DNA-binding NtrC family response regulator